MTQEKSEQEIIEEIIVVSKHFKLSDHIEEEHDIPSNKREVEECPSCVVELLEMIARNALQKGKEIGSSNTFIEEERLHSKLAQELGARAGKNAKKLKDKIVELEKENKELKSAVNNLIEANGKHMEIFADLTDQNSKLADELELEQPECSELMILEKSCTQRKIPILRTCANCRKKKNIERIIKKLRGEKD